MTPRAALLLRFMSAASGAQRLSKDRYRAPPPAGQQGDYVCLSTRDDGPRVLLAPSCSLDVLSA